MRVEGELEGRTSNNVIITNTWEKVRTKGLSWGKPSNMSSRRENVRDTSTLSSYEKKNFTRNQTRKVRLVYGRKNLKNRGGEKFTKRGERARREGCSTTVGSREGRGARSLQYAIVWQS